MERLATTGQVQEAPKIATISLWCPPEETLALGNDEVHVWCAVLDPEAPEVKRLWRTLSTDERIRADQIHFQKDCEHFIVARGLLRAILGRYLGMEPSDLQFCYNPHGKPALAGVSSKNSLHFNVSHSHGLALYAITHGRQLGVDLERLRSDLEAEQIAVRFFSAREIGALRALPKNMQLEAFYNCWTRKEAYLKARGEGLMLHLDQFEVSLVPGEPAALLHTSGDPYEASRWSMMDLVPHPGYVAALAVEGHDWRLKCWQWPP